MLKRFALYSFLKNQRYFEPFLVLIFLEKGLTFLDIGMLIAMRELVVNLIELASGALADVYGRRLAMVVSFLSYIVSFVLLGVGTSMAMLGGAMVFYGVGDAFRTGTHKAMIFTWMRLQGRDDRTEVYGYTRSWGKVGSALSVVLAAFFVLAFNAYTPVLFISIVPYVLGLVNFMGYPRELDGDRPEVSAWQVVLHLKDAVVRSVREDKLRGLLIEAMGFEGVFKSSKDYLQPLLKTAAMTAFGASTLALAQGFGEAQKVALLTGPVYFVLFLLSAYASRRAHKVEKRAGSVVAASRWLWGLMIATLLIMLPALYLGVAAIAIAGFVAMYLLQNLWRPIMMSRIDAECEPDQQATILSVEHQATSFGTMILAPILGAAVDYVTYAGPGESLWPIAAIGLLVVTASLLASVSGRRTVGV